MYIVILNFETSQIDCLDLCNLPTEQEHNIAEYTETTLNYSLSNCEYMIVKEKPVINNLNY